MKERHFIAFLVTGALALVGLVLVKPWSRFAHVPAPSPLAIIPAGAAFVADVDLARLRKSAAGSELSQLGLQRFAPASPTAAFQPLRDVDEFVIAVAGGARLAREGAAPFESDVVAVVATGRFSGKAAADAAVERIRARGGEPVRTRLGTFESVRDLRATGEVAARNGLVVLSDGAYLRAVLAAAEGQRTDGNETERTRDRVHAELRRTFARNAPITATLTLPEGSLEAALGDAEVRRSPLALVRSAAVRVDVADGLALRALLLCASAEDSARVRRFLLDARDDLANALGSRLPSAEIGPESVGRVELSLSLSTSELARALAPPDAGP